MDRPTGGTGSAPASPSSVRPPPAPLTEAERTPLSRFASDTRTLDQALTAVVERHQELDRRFKGVINDPDTLRTLHSAVGTDTLLSHATEVSRLKAEAQRAATAGVSTAAASAAANATAKYRNSESALRARALDISDRLDVAFAMIDSGHIDLRQLSALKADPVRFKEAMGEIRAFTQLDPFVMRNQLTDLARDTTEIRSLRGKNNTVVQRAVSIRWTPTGAVQMDAYLQPGSTATLQTHERQPERFAEPWMKSLSELRSAQADLAKRFPDLDDFFQVDRVSQASTIRSASNSIGPKMSELAGTTDPARRDKLLREIGKAKQDIVVESTLLAERYKKLGELIEVGAISVSDLTSLKKKDPPAHAERINTLRSLLQVDGQLMGITLALRPPIDRPSGKLDSPPTLPARPTVLSAREPVPNSPAPRTQWNGAGPNPDHMCASIVSNVQDAYRDFIKASVDFSNAAERSNLIHIRARSAVQTLTATEVSYPSVRETKRLARDILEARNTSPQVFESIAAEAADFRRQVKTAELKLAGDPLKVRLEELRKESTEKIVDFARKDIGTRLPGAIPTGEDIANILMTRSAMGDVVTRSNLRALAEASKVGPSAGVSSNPSSPPTPKSDRVAVAVAPPTARPPTAVANSSVTAPPLAPVTNAVPRPVTDAEAAPPVQLPPAMTVPIEPQVKPHIPVPREPEQLTSANAQPLATFYADGVTSLQIKLPNGNFVLYDAIQGTEKEAFGKMQSGALAAEGVEIRSVQRSDGTHDVAVVCKFPGEVRILARRGGNAVAVTKDRSPSTGGSHVPRYGEEHILRVDPRESAERNDGKLKQSLQLGADKWHGNITTATKFEGKSTEYFYSSSDRRLYARSPDHKTYFAYNKARNTWHTVPRDSLPPNM